MGGPMLLGPWHHAAGVRSVMRYVTLLAPWAIALGVMAGSRLSAEDPPKTGGPFEVALAGKKPYYLYVPVRYTADRSWPLVVQLHPGAFGAKQAMDLYTEEAGKRGYLVAGPQAATNAIMP